MQNVINENIDAIVYNIELEGDILAEGLSSTVAQTYVSKLKPQTQAKVKIVPVTTSGLKVLLG